MNDNAIIIRVKPVINNNKDGANAIKLIKNNICSAEETSCGSSVPSHNTFNPGQFPSGNISDGENGCTTTGVGGGVGAAAFTCKGKKAAIKKTAKKR
jgi:hypothetical protein